MGSGWLWSALGIPLTIEGFKIDVDDALAFAMRFLVCELPDVGPDEQSSASMLSFDRDSEVDFLLIGGGVWGNRPSEPSRTPLGTRGSDKFVLLTLIFSPAEVSE